MNSKAFFAIVWFGGFLFLNVNMYLDNRRLEHELEHLRQVASPRAGDTLQTLFRFRHRLPIPPQVAPPQVATTPAPKETPAIEGQTASPAQTLWLLVVVPSLPRPHEEPYLLRTLEAYRKELPTDRSDPFYHAIHVLVFCPRNPLAHRIFAQARDDPRFGGPQFSFEADEESKLTSEPNRQHAIDVGHLLRRAKAYDASHVLLAEDDFTLCPHGFKAIHHAITKATRYNPEWAMLRVSYGTNGLITKDKHLLNLQDYLATQSATSTRAIDLLSYDFFVAMAHGSVMASRYNMFRHIGDSSTFADHGDRYSPVCYQLLNDWLQQGEQFDFVSCPHDDLSPCNPPDPDNHPRFIDWDATEQGMCPIHFPICDESVSATDALTRHCRHRKP